MKETSPQRAQTMMDTAGEPADCRTPFGLMNMPDPTIDPTIMATPFLSKQNILRLVSVEKRKKLTDQFGQWVPYQKRRPVVACFGEEHSPESKLATRGWPLATRRCRMN